MFYQFQPAIQIRQKGRLKTRIASFQTTFVFEQAVYALPVLPKPPSPRSLAANSFTTLNEAWMTGTMTICAMRSIGSMVNASLPLFHTETLSSP